MRRDKESGYALLLVFLMAAVIAISLYSEIPRVAFQSQRHKEQLLMQRGQQYMRAIQLYRQLNHNVAWPPDLDNLETFQNRHLLRHKYVDPMTGKSEWRLIHIQGNVLTDSALTKKPAAQPDTGSQSNYISSYAALGDAPPAAQALRPQDRRRASEGPSAPGTEGQLQPSDPNSQLASGAQPGSSASPPGAPGMPGANFPGQTGMPGTNSPDQSQGNPPAAYIGALPGLGVSPQSSPFLPIPGAPGQPGQPGYPNPQASGSAPPGSNSVVSMINQMLTTPNPRAAQIIAQQGQQVGTSGGLGDSGGGFALPGGSFGPGMTSAGSSPAGSSAPGAASGGVAGVASKMKQEGIMVYNDRTAYNEWEFVFDPAKVTPIPPPTSGGVQGSTPAGQLSPAGAGAQMGAGLPGGQTSMGMGAQTGQLGGPFGSPSGAFGPAAGPTGSAAGTFGSGPMGQMGAPMGPGAPASGAGGSTNNPAGPQTAGGPAANLPPIRLGRP